MLRMENLERCFKRAIEVGAEYVAVKIHTRGSEGEEVIINPKENFISKMEYYQKAYNDDLTLKSFNGIRIVGFTFADSYEDVEKDLFGTP